MTRTVLQLRKGTQVQHTSFTGQIGEVTVDTTRKTLVVHDGTTAGGSALATLSSPALTGTPTAPTASTGTNNSQLATTAFVANTIATVGSGPVNTDALPEGSTKLYFTQARARASISVTGSLGYDANTGVVSYTTPTLISAFTNDAGYLTNSNLRSQISATGSINYNTATGVISYTQAVNSVNGLVGTIVLSTLNVTENLNLYYTDARSRSAISVTGPNISYSSGNGLITTTNPTQLVNTSNDSVSLTTNNFAITINNVLKLQQDATKLATSRIQALDVNPGSNGNTLTIQGGAGGTGSGNSGALVLQGGTTSDGDGGNVSLTASDGVGSLRNAGSVTITSGSPGFGGSAGNITAQSRGVLALYQAVPGIGLPFGGITIGSSESLPTSPNQGGVYIYSSRQVNTSSTAGGLIDIKTSNGTLGGPITITSGNGATGNGGNITIASGLGSGASNQGGSISLTPGDGLSGATTGTIQLNGNITVQASKVITQTAAPTTDFHLTNRRFVNKTSLAYSIALS